MHKRADTPAEINRKKKSMKISLIFHASILLLAFFPLIAPSTEPQEFMHAIEIKFEDLESSTRKSGRSIAARSGEPAKRTVPLPAQAIQNAVPKQLNMPERLDILTAPEMDIKIPVFEDAHDDQMNEPVFDEFKEIEDLEEIDEIEDQVVEEVNEEVFEVMEVFEEEIAEVGPAWLNDDYSSEGIENSGDGGSGNDPSSDYTGNSQGTYDDGTHGNSMGSSGEDAGEGNQGKGYHWGDSAGEGIFNRKVIKRANIGKLALEEGKIVIKLCIGKGGEVIYAEADPSSSSIRNSGLLEKAEESARHYVFEKDLSAPETQCGRLSFIFEIDR
jgi:hypothetical protein